MGHLQTISSLANKLEEYIDTIGQVALFELDWEGEITAELTLIDNDVHRIEYLKRRRSIERSDLRKIRYWSEARTRPVSDWCQSFIRGWLKTQCMSFDAYTWPLAEPFLIGSDNEIIDEIFANKHHMEGFENYAKALRMCQRYDWLTKQLTELSDSQQNDATIKLRNALGLTTAFDEKPGSPDKTSTGLFIDSEAEAICVNALIRIDPPLINTAGQWIDSKRGKKSMLVAWWDAATVNGHVRQPANDRELSRMLNEYFPGLDLETKDAGIFRQNTSARTRYQPHFLALMPEKKLTKLRR